MQNKLISATKLYEVESMLMTDSIRENAVASNLLHQVLSDIERRLPFMLIMILSRLLKQCQIKIRVNGSFSRLPCMKSVMAWAASKVFRKTRQKPS